MMTKNELIDEIRRLNHTAPSDFLSTFAETDLQTYLERLHRLFGQRGRRSGWIRPGDTHAVVTLQH